MKSAFGVIHKLNNPARGQRAARLAMNFQLKGKLAPANRAKAVWAKNQGGKK